MATAGQESRHGERRALVRACRKKVGLSQAELARLAADRLRLSRAEIDHALARLGAAIPRWTELLRDSFLDEHAKEIYLDLLEQRRSVLQL